MLKLFAPGNSGGGTGRQKISIIVNEFGKEGVDGKLLSDLGASLSEISGGSIFCSCRLDQFESALNGAALVKPDVLITETSGLSDPVSIHKILSSENWSGKYLYKGCICLADAVNLPKVYKTARVCKKQLSICDMVLINKTDLATEEQLNETHEIISGQCPLVPVFETSFGKIEAAWLEKLNEHGNEKIHANFHTADINLHSLLVKISEDFSAYDLIKFLEMFAEDSYRIKGFVILSGKIYLVDCVGALVKVSEYPENKEIPAGEVSNNVNVLYGYGQPAKKSVENAVKWYAGKAAVL